MKRVWNGLLSALVWVLVPAAVLLLTAQAAGLQIFTVLSGSMEPSYHVGSLIFVRQTDGSSLSPGQSVTFFTDGDIPVTHRVVEVLTGADGSVQYRTKGDANQVPDAKIVDARQVIGVPCFTVPYLGYALSWIQSIHGRWTLAGVGVILVFGQVLTGLFRPKTGWKKTEVQAEDVSANDLC